MDMKQAGGKDLKSWQAFSANMDADLAEARAARSRSYAAGQVQKHGPNKNWRRAIRAEKGSEAAKYLDDIGEAYIETAVPSDKPIKKMSTLELKTKLGIVDTDPKGIRNLGTPLGLFERAPGARPSGYVFQYGNEFGKRTPSSGLFRHTRETVKGLGRMTGRAFTNVFENSPGFRLLERMGISPPTQELRSLRAAAEEGLTGQKAVQKLQSDTTGRAGKYAYATDPGKGGDLVRQNMDKTFKTGSQEILTTHATRGTGNTPKVTIEDVRPDVIKDSKVPTYEKGNPTLSKAKQSSADILGKSTKRTLQALPVIGGLDDASVVVQDVLEGDVTGAILHTGDAIVDTFIGPFSLIATIPTNSATGADSRGLFSAGAAWLGIEESTASTSAIEKLVSGDWTFGGGEVLDEPSNVKQTVATYGGSGGMMI